MRTSVKLLFFVSLLSFMAACNNAPKGEKVEAEDAVETPSTPATTADQKGSATYKLQNQVSQVIWTGSKLAGGQHNGTVSFQSGEVNLSDGQLVGGKFVLDMNSITNLDQKAGEGKEKLEGHLKSGDFFEVEKFPTGEFEITNVSAVSGQDEYTHNITGNLTLKGITKSITVPAKVTIAPPQLNAVTPQFVIDRTQWDVKFKSGLLGTAKDQIINDEVGLKLIIVAIDSNVQ